MMEWGAVVVNALTDGAVASGSREMGFQAATTN